MMIDPEFEWILKVCEIAEDLDISIDIEQLYFKLSFRYEKAVR